MATQPLVHEDLDKKSDKELAAEAAGHLARNPHLKVLSSLLSLLLSGDFPWWTSNLLLQRLPIKERMEFLGSNKFARQRITSGLTKVPAEALLDWEPAFQTELIERVLKSGVITEDAVNAAFESDLLVVYMDAGRFWKLFRERMPWEDNSPEHRHHIGTLIELFLAHKILTPLIIRSAISGRVWHTHIPMPLLIEIDEALLEREREAPGMPYHAEDVLRVVGPMDLAEHIPLTELQGIMDAAEKAMGFFAPLPLPSELNPHPTMAPPPKNAEPEAEAASSIPDGGTQATQGDIVDLTPEETAALVEEDDAGGEGSNGETSGDTTQVFNTGDFPRLDSTVVAGSFEAAIKRSGPPSPRGLDLERSSSGGLSASTIQNFATLEEAGFTFDGALDMDPAVAHLLRQILVDRQWSLDAELLRRAQVAFMRAIDSHGPSEEELQKKSDTDLESRFFRMLLRVASKGTELVKALHLSKSQQVPPLSKKSAAR